MKPKARSSVCVHAASTEGSHRTTGNLRVHVRDADTGQPLHCRVCIYGKDRKTLCCDGELEVPLRPGEYRVDVTRGFDYESQSANVSLGGSEDTVVDVKLKRRIAMRERGWVGGENHCHVIHTLSLARSGLDLDYAARVGRAEGLDYLQVCPAWDPSNRFYSAADLNRRCGKLSDSLFLLSWNLEAPKTYFGEDHGGRKGNLHCYGHGWTMGMTDHGGDREFFRTPPNFVAHDYIHQQGGIVSYAHPARLFVMYGNIVSNMASELPLDTVLGPTYDTIDILNDVPPLFFLSERIWFTILNLGYQMPGTTASDTCLEREHTRPGKLRLYTQLHGKLSMKRLARAVKQGRNLATTGPLVFVDVDGVEPGDVLAADGRARTMHVEAYGPPGEDELLETVQLIRNGCVVSVVDLSRKRLRHWHGSFPITENDNASYVVKVLAQNSDPDGRAKWGTDCKHHAVVNPVYFRRSDFRQPRPPRTQVDLCIHGAGKKNVPATVRIVRRGKVTKILRKAASCEQMSFSMQPDSVVEVAVGKEKRRLTVMDDERIFDFTRNLDFHFPTFYSAETYHRLRGMLKKVSLNADVSGASAGAGR